MGVVETREVDPPGRGRGMGHEAWVGKGKWEVMWWDTGRGGADGGRHEMSSVVEFSHGCMGVVVPGGGGVDCVERG